MSTTLAIPSLLLSLSSSVGVPSTVPIMSLAASAGTAIAATVVDAAPIIPASFPVGGGGGGTVAVAAAGNIAGPVLLSPMYFRRTSPFAARQRRYGQRGQQYRRDTSTYSTGTDMSEHYLDEPNWMTDPNIRPWTGNGQSSSSSRRRVNQGQSWTSRLVVLNVVSFIAQQAYPRYTAWGVKLSERIMNGKDLYRLASPVFLHGDLWHIAMNMYSLQNVGPIAERYFGPGRFIMSYLTAGIAGNLLSAMMSPNPALGASGAIFGVSGMILVFLQRNEWLFGRQGEAMQSSVVQNIGINLFYGFMNPRVDNWGHLGGAIGGAMAAYYFGPRLYLAPLPGTESVTVVDKPILRLPRWVESLPEKASNRARRLVRRMQVWQFTDNLPSRPWRTGGSGDRLKRTDYKRRQINTPNQSIKPNIEE